MLRSRVENRPNSSVTDFRRQLNKLQSTATPSRGGMRSMGRPLAPPTTRRATSSGGGVSTLPRQSSMRAHAASSASPAPARVERPRAAAGRDTSGYRTHGDPSGGVPRPSRVPDGPTADPRAELKRRRMNVLFLLVVVTGCTLFLAGTTGSTPLLYVFSLSFLALCGYVYLLAQLRQRESVGWNNDTWFDR
jgi:hypothetical protein